MSQSGIVTILLWLFFSILTSISSLWYFTFAHIFSFACILFWLRYVYCFLVAGVLVFKSRQAWRFAMFSINFSLQMIEKIIYFSSSRVFLFVVSNPLCSLDSFFDTNAVFCFLIYDFRDSHCTLTQCDYFLVFYNSKILQFVLLFFDSCILRHFFSVYFLI